MELRAVVVHAARLVVVDAPRLRRDRGVVRFERRAQLHEQVGLQHRVVVDREHEAVARRAHAGVARRARALVLEHRQELDVYGEPASQELDAPVGRAVVDHDELVDAALERQDRAEALLEVVLALVVDDDGGDRPERARHQESGSSKSSAVTGSRRFRQYGHVAEHAPGRLHEDPDRARRLLHRAPDPDRARRVGDGPLLLLACAAQEHLGQHPPRHPQQVLERRVLEHPEPRVARVVVEAALAHLHAEGLLVVRDHLGVLEHPVAEVEQAAGQVALVAVDEEPLVIEAGLPQGRGARERAAAPKRAHVAFAVHRLGVQVGLGHLGLDDLGGEHRGRPGLLHQPQGRLLEPLRRELDVVVEDREQRRRHAGEADVERLAGAVVRVRHHDQPYLGELARESPRRCRRCSRCPPRRSTRTAASGRGATAGSRGRSRPCSTCSPPRSCAAAPAGARRARARAGARRTRAARSRRARPSSGW